MNWDLLQNSLALSLSVTALAVGLGFVISIALAALPSTMRKAGQLCLVIMLALPPFLIANAWLRLLGYGGALRPFLDVSILSLGGCILVLTFMLTPITALLLTPAWTSLNGSLMEVDDSLRSRKLIRHLLLPAGSAQLKLSALITFVLAFNHFSIPALFQTKVFPVELWISFNTNFSYRTAAWNALPLIIVPLLGLMLIKQNRTRWPQGTPASPALFRGRVGLGLFSASVTALGIAVTLGLFPLYYVLFSAETWSELARTFATNRNELWNSVALALGTSAICVGLSLVAWKQRALKSTWILFFAPGALLGICLIWIFNRPGLSPFYQSLGIAILALMLRYFAVAWSGVRHARLTSDPRLTDAAMLGGTSRWQTFRHAVLPQAAPKLVVTALAVYVLTLWDVEALSLIVPPGGETLSWRVFNLLHYGHTAQVNAMCLLVLFVALVPLALWFFARKMLSRAALLVPILLGLGCSPLPDGQTKVESEIFESVHIIGTRGAGAGQFNKPRSLACDRDDNLYVADITGRVQKFSPGGKYLLAWQMPQTDIGKPKGMDRDSDGNIIVIEPHYSRVNHFDRDGKLQHQWGVHGTNQGQLSFPRAAAVTREGNLWISEYGATERVQLFTKGGTNCLMAFGSRGSAPSLFDRPEGIGIGRDGELLVADSCNHRVQLFTADGRFMSEFGKPGTGSGELGYPGDVRADFEGRIYVAEFGNSRIQIFDRAGKSLEIIGGIGSAPGQMHNPWSIAFDSKGNLYVADAGNHRVQKFVRKGNNESAQRLVSDPKRKAG